MRGYQPQPNGSSGPKNPPTGRTDLMPSDPRVKALVEALKLALDYVDGCKVNRLPDLGAASNLPFMDDVLRIGDAALKGAANE